MWRLARPEDFDRISDFCRTLYAEDPGPEPVDPEQIRRTLDVFRREPWRGRAAVLELDGAVEGYALLIPFWSNELGGEVCEVDELCVSAASRGQGHGGELFAAIERAEIWPSAPVAIALGTTPGNDRARRLYQRLGFQPVGTLMVKRANRRTRVDAD